MYSFYNKHKKKNISRDSAAVKNFKESQLECKVSFLFSNGSLFPC